MAVTLLNVDAHVSLEFDPSDFDAVRACIDAPYPDWTVTPAGIATIIGFGGERFTYQNEWDDPCLISSSTRGDELLRNIYTALFED